MLKRLIGIIPSSLNFHDKFCLPEKECSIDIELAYGFIKLIFDAKYGELLGGHMIGANVTEMIAEIVALRKLETTGQELIKTIHPHPTMSEAIMEAAAAAYGEVIHM